MKKIFKNMAWMLAATMAMAACSDSLEESSGNGNSNEYVGDKGYVNIGINLPTTASTRANDEFNDGDSDEYKVNDVIIALFYDTEGSSGESNATCKWAFKLDDTNFVLSGTITDNITSYYASGVRMIPAPEKNVYALAIVNPISKFNVSAVSTSSNADKENAGDAVLTTCLTVDGTPFNGTLSTLNKELTAVIKDVTGGSYNDFMMTNAPIANQKSFVYNTRDGKFEVTTLAPIKIYNDKALAEGAAKDNPIYVERVVAKTQVKIGGGSTDGSLAVTSDVTAYNGATVQFKGWKLQNTNKKYYPVRKVTDESIGWASWITFNPSTSISNKNNRFFGSESGPYRTYWGIDPNYSGDISDDDYNVVETDESTTAWNTVGYNTTSSQIEYCLENTTTAQTMEDDRLTSVLLKATFTPDNAQSGDNFFMINNTSAIYTELEFLDWAKNTLINAGKTATGELSIGSSLSTGAIITTSDDIKKLIISSGSGELSDDQANVLLTAAGSNIKYYKNGVTYYYATVIKHFGDSETPLDGKAINNAATDYVEADHLGRYGVLRNNWYELTINSVSGPGEPVIPEIPTTPPDKENSYINCEINVLSWAKRSQSVDL